MLPSSSLVDFAHGNLDTQLPRALVKAGVDEDAATAIAQRLEHRAGPSAMPILVAATLAGFGLIAIGIGWVKSDIGELRTELQSEAGQFRTELKTEVGQLRTEIVANRDRIDAVSERLTRIETLLDERLPPRR